MDCNEARRRLTEELSVERTGPRDEALRQHLATCSHCAALAQASLHLRQAFEQSRKQEDRTSMPEFAQVRREVAKVAGPGGRVGGLQAMTEYWQKGSGRIRWGIGLGAAVVVLALLTLIPFSYERTVGYEVAFAGVDPALAMNEDRLRTMLDRLGCGSATVELGECEATCELKISDLKEMKQCKVIIHALKDMGNVEVLLEGEPLREEAHGPIFELARHNVFFSADETPGDEEVHSYLVECLGEDYGSEMNVWVHEIDAESGSGARAVMIGCESASTNPGQACYMVKCADSAAGICGIKVDGDGKIACTPQDITRCLTICDTTGSAGVRFHEILKEAGLEASDLKGDLDPEMRAKLEALGIRIRFERLSPETGNVELVEAAADTGQYSTGDQEVKAARESAFVPGQYLLRQNYPNPFNPKTAITFNLGASGPVRLEVFNTLGQRVRTLVDGTLQAGPHAITWDARSDGGQRVPSGTYLYRLQAGDFVESKAMTLLK